MEILDPGKSIVEVARCQLLLAADVKHNRQPCFLRQRPQRFESDMAGRVTPRAARWDQERLAAQFNRVPRRGEGALEGRQRYIAGAEKSPIHRAEMTHHAIVGA